ncbi:MAG: error-prone DNA polymerase [Parasphingorhabdus sp.]|uniref:error-prone DNA polymerase n=1 Tax=Parasphingorhabdus sp. TaxID=2709688 RepID=UPI0032986958
MTAFAELVATTHYSFLRGASAPADMVLHAIKLGMNGLGIADRNSVAGVVRAHVALRQVREDAAEEGVELPPFHLIVGARLCFVDEMPDIIAYPVNRKGWGRLTRLLSIGNLRTEKGACHLMLGDLLNLHQDMQFIAMADEGELKLLQPLMNVAHDRLWVGVTMPRDGADRRYLARLQQEAARLDLPLLATNAPLFATAEQRPLSDILTCISEKTTISEAGRLLAKNAESHLKPPQEMARLFADCPQAIEATQRFLSGIHFSLDELSYHYPDEPVPDGWTPQGWLEHLTREAAAKAHPDGIPHKLSAKLSEELELINKLEYAPYFLTVHDIVRHARSKDILCQGRGSAANSVVCYLLGITSVDPMKHDLLFSRFISQERKEPPDIDVDFEHERREEIIQYIYDRYGRSRAAIAATVVHYRSRSAIREVGKALGLSEDITSRLSSTVWGSWSTKDPDKRFGETGLDPESPEIARLGALVQQILEFPRHLSQHVGGFVLTQDRLDETVPIHNAAMEDRTFIEWDKNDIDALGLMKVDVLALGMLTCIRKCFDMMRTYGLGDYALATVPTEDSVTYDMLCEGDSVGVFQVESRAQINMLPRLRPREFYDLVIQVAIVRPGPIEGDMVHPYLRRRSGVEKTEYPSPAPPHDPDELRGVLGRTFGVPLFQEQAMKLAIVAADFSPTDANKLRRAMATFRNVGTIHHFQAKMIEGMVARGYDREFAERCYNQIQGFGSYGFPESHAQSFAILVYISSWIKCHHPAVFAAALLNSQPMGFYAPAQIIRDAREHDVEVRSIDINHSQWDNILEASRDGSHAVRLGLRQIDGFREAWAEQMIACRPFASIEELSHGAKLPQRAMQLLADADACRSIGLDRRQALWEVRRTPSGTLPLFAAADARELAQEEDAQLPDMTRREHVITDYQTTRLSLKGHPMEFLREAFHRQKVLCCADVAHAKNGSIAEVAGIVLIRQRPGKGNAIFVTLEDETGIANILIWARLFERYRRPIMAARLMKVRGEVQKSKEGVIHIIASHVQDYTDRLDRVAAARPGIKASDTEPAVAANRGHPRNVRILPGSRDFH